MRKRGFFVALMRDSEILIDGEELVDLLAATEAAIQARSCSNGGQVAIATQDRPELSAA